MPVLVSPPDAIHRSNDKAETYAFLQRLGAAGAGLPARRRRGARSRRRRTSSATRSAPVCFKPVFSSGRAASASSTRPSTARDQLLRERPGSVSMLLEDAVEILARSTTAPSCS